MRPQQCSATSHTCIECAAGDPAGCATSPSGAVCLASGVCGCLADGQCGGVDSGLICGSASRCVTGCRTSGGGNGCPRGMSCVAAASGGTVGACVGPRSAGGHLGGGGLACAAAQRGALASPLGLFALGLAYALARARVRTSKERS
jgi:hypothetical protein